MIDAPIPGPVAEPDPREPAIEPDEKITVLLRSMTLESGAKVAVGTAEGREETFFRFSNRDGVETKFCLSPEAVDALRDLLGQKRGGSVSGAELMWRLVEHVAS